MTTTKTEYGRYEHGKPYADGRSFFRRDVYFSDEEGRQGSDRLFATGKADDSPVFTGRYDAKCSCCYLHFAHTTDKHNQAIK